MKYAYTKNFLKRCIDSLVIYMETFWPMHSLTIHCDLVLQIRTDKCKSTNLDPCQAFSFVFKQESYVAVSCKVLLIARSELMLLKISKLARGEYFMCPSLNWTATY